MTLFVPIFVSDIFSSHFFLLKYNTFHPNFHLWHFFFSNFFCTQTHNIVFKKAKCKKSDVSMKLHIHISSAKVALLAHIVLKWRLNRFNSFRENPRLAYEKKNTKNVTNSQTYITFLPTFLRLREIHAFCIFKFLIICKCAVFKYIVVMIFCFLFYMKVLLSNKN